MSSGITRDEWIRALSDAGIEDTDDQGALTVAEFAAMFKLRRHVATHRLATLVDAGKAIKTQKRGRNAIGRSVLFVAYRLTDTPPPTRRAQRGARCR